MPRMNRLSAEYLRLYLPADAVPEGAAPLPLIGPDGRVRAMVLGLGRPAEWTALAAVWRGVQSDLGWPAPAIAVNGVDAFELWFSMAEPLPVAEAATLLQALAARYLGSVKPARLRLWPDGARPSAQPDMGRIPALQAETGRWSAFVAPDLPAVFGDDPSLDFQPGEDAQAELLAGCASIPTEAFRAALGVLQPAVLAVSATPTQPSAPSPSPAGKPGGGSYGPHQEPRAFLLDVMNDPSVDLALRIEVAKALLRS